MHDNSSAVSARTRLKPREWKEWESASRDSPKMETIRLHWLAAKREVGVCSKLEFKYSTTEFPSHGSGGNDLNTAG